MFKQSFTGVCAAFLFSTMVSAPLSAAGEDPVLATVNGVNITRSEVVRAQTQLPQQYQKIPMEIILPNLLDSIVDGYLAADYARDQGYQKSDEFKTEIGRVERQILQSMALTREIDAKVTDAALKKYYDGTVASKGGAEEIHARHILVKTEDEAKAVIAELDKGGDFIELAKTKSTGPSGPTGGDLGFFGHGQMVPDFEKAAYALKKGDYTKTAAKTQFGYHVIKLEDRRTGTPPTFEESVEKMRAELSQKAGLALIESLRAKAKIEKFLDRIAKPAKDGVKTVN